MSVGGRLGVKVMARYHRALCRGRRSAYHDTGVRLHRGVGRLIDADRKKSDRGESDPGPGLGSHGGPHGGLRDEVLTALHRDVAGETICSGRDDLIDGEAIHVHGL